LLLLWWWTSSWRRVAVAVVVPLVVGVALVVIEPLLAHPVVVRLPKQALA
jgi:hypothetical protein